MILNSNRAVLLTSRVQSNPKDYSSTRCEPVAAQASHLGSAEKTETEKPRVSLAFLQRLGTFLEFNRPHVVLGTLMGVISACLVAAQGPEEIISAPFLVGAVQSVLVFLTINTYVQGVNQIYDLEIDKVNKPYLPLASGEYTISLAVVLSSLGLACCCAIGLASQSMPLKLAAVICFVITTGYSVDAPFLRWKRWPMVGSVCIIIGRAVALPIGTYFHINSVVFGRDYVLPRKLLLSVALLSLHLIVISLAKDIPDMEGDERKGIRTWSVRVGRENIFWLCVRFYLAMCGGAMVVSAFFPSLWSRIAAIVCYGAMGFAFWVKSSAVEVRDKSHITEWYMFIWKLLYLQYVLIPLLR